MSEMNETVSGLTEETKMRARLYFLTLPGVIGGEVKVAGVQHGRARLVARNASTVVVAFAGWGENPGSRYSGLKTYYPAETKVYQIIQENATQYGHVRVLELISYQTRPSAK